MARLIIKRTKHWMHRKQPVCIFCDEKYIDCVNNDESKTIELEEGVHTVSVKMSSYRSRVLSVELKNNQLKTLELSIPKWLVYGDIISAFIIVFYFLMKLFIDMKEYSYIPPVVLAFAAAYMIYNLLFVRKRYFKLSAI